MQGKGQGNGKLLIGQFPDAGYDSAGGNRQISLAYVQSVFICQKFYEFKKEIDKIICELITRHPYVENAMRLKLSVQWTDGNITGYYHILDFDNDNFEQQNRGNLEIKYEK